MTNNIKTINGLADASVKTWGGLARASIKTIDGLDATASGGLQAIIPSTVFYLDMTNSSSYTGSGSTWSNLIAAPADGSAQSAYNFTAPNSFTFNGSAGSSAAYATFNGTTQYFSLASGSNTTFLANLHKTTPANPFWIICLFYTGTTASNIPFFNTAGSATDHGIQALAFASNSNLRLSQSTGTNVNNTNYTLSQNTNYMWTMSHDQSTNALRRGLNVTSFSTDTMTFNTDTTNATYAALIGQRPAAVGYMPTGVRLYAVAMGNGYLTDAELSAAKTFFQTQHGRTY